MTVALSILRDLFRAQLMVLSGGLAFGYVGYCRCLSSLLILLQYLQLIYGTWALPPLDAGQMDCILQMGLVVAIEPTLTSGDAESALHLLMLA